MGLMDYLPFFYVGALVVYTLIVAYTASGVFLHFGNTQRFWFFLLLVFNIYMLAFGICSQFMAKHKGKLGKQELQKIWALLAIYAVFLLIPIVAAFFFEVNPLF